ncbi:unnamed protein product [Ectocarpus sp. 12 AP-2014]
MSPSVVLTCENKPSQFMRLGRDTNPCPNVGGLPGSQQRAMCRAVLRATKTWRTAGVHSVGEPEYFQLNASPDPDNKQVTAVSLNSLPRTLDAVTIHAITPVAARPRTWGERGIFTGARHSDWFEFSVAFFPPVLLRAAVEQLTACSPTFLASVHIHL